MIFDTPPTSGNSSLQKSPHHKSTSALTDVQTSTLPPSSKQSSSAAYPTYPQGKKANTLAVTESPSYLSSIGGYADEFEDLSPSSAGSTNTSYMSGYRNFDLGDEILQHYGAVSPHENHSSRSPTGFSRKSDSKHHVEIPAASSPITRYKRASSPTIGFPTDSHKQFVVSHGDQPHHHTQQYTHALDIHRSHSPDIHNNTTHPGSYTPPGMLNRMSAHGNKQLTPQKLTHLYQQQQHSGSNRGGGGRMSPSNYSNQHTASGFNKGGQQQHTQQQNDARPPSHSRYSDSIVPGTNIPNSQSRRSTSSAHSGVEPGSYRNPRKASDQEMGLLEVLNMWDKSTKSPFGDGTLV